MSVLAVTNRRSAGSAGTPSEPQPAASTRPEGIATRARRALMVSGWLALVLGQTLGLLAANPALLASRLPFPLDPVAMVLIGFGLTGLLVGLVAGLALRGASTGLRLAVALFGLLIALIAFDLSFGLLRGLSLAAALMSVDDGVKLGQAGLGMLGAGIGILAGRVPARPAEPVSLARPATPARRRAARTSTAQSSRQPARTSAASSSSQPAQASASASSRQPARRRRAAAATGSTAAASAPAPAAPLSINLTPRAPDRPAKPAKRRRTLFARRKVRLGAEQTAVCPYCLEEVKPNDPRGKVVCQICGTAHHADCWAITGKCEVPHLQT